MHEMAPQPNLEVVTSRNLEKFLEKIYKIDFFNETIELIIAHYPESNASIAEILKSLDDQQNNDEDGADRMAKEIMEFRKNIAYFFNESLVFALYSTFRNDPDFNLNGFISKLNSDDANSLEIIQKTFGQAEDTFWSFVDSHLEEVLTPLQILKQ